MRIKNSILVLLLILSITFITSTSVTAEEIVLEEGEVEVVVAETTKYFKTVTVLNNSEVLKTAGFGEVSSITTEVTEEEYNNVSETDSIDSVSVETTYKKLTTTISQYGPNYYKYKAVLTWKKMPSTRSYDIIGLGYYASVSAATDVDFQEDYCTTGGTCNTMTAYYSYTGKNGIGAMFSLPSSSLASLSQTLYVYVGKTNSSSTIVEQFCTGAYRHATSTISYSKAKKFTVDTGGIQLDSSIESYYDSVGVSETWTGTW